jgi:hypothetical protein
MEEYRCGHGLYKRSERDSYPLHQLCSEGNQAVLGPNTINMMTVCSLSITWQSEIIYSMRSAQGEVAWPIYQDEQL